MTAKTPSETDPLGSSGASAPGGEGETFFKSAGGLKSDVGTADYQEGGIGPGGAKPAPGAGRGRLGVVVQGGILGIIILEAILAIIIQGGRGADLGIIIQGGILAIIIQGGILAIIIQGGILAIVVQGGRRPLAGGLLAGSILAIIIQGGILAIVVQGGRFPSFGTPNACAGAGWRYERSALALRVEAPAPCVNATSTVPAQPTTTAIPLATNAPQATNTPQKQPTATPQPTNIPQAQLPRLSVSTTQASAFCLNNQYPSITVKNTGGQTLKWSASGPGSPNPVTPSPSSGSLSPGHTRTVGISGSRPGPTVSIQFTSNGGTATVTFTCQ